MNVRPGWVLLMTGNFSTRDAGDACDVGDVVCR